MSANIQGLIRVLLDPLAREDERHDAAMDLGDFSDDRALDALIIIGTNLSENAIILDAVGESIGEILVKRNKYNEKLINSLAPIAQKTAMAYIHSHKQEWVEGGPGGGQA